MKTLQKTNTVLVKIIEDCNKLGIKSKFWKKISKELTKSTKRMPEVNILKLNKVTKPKETIIIPGKLLGLGTLNHDLTVYAFKYSESVRDKIKNLYSIQDLIKKNPQGKGIRIIC